MPKPTRRKGRAYMPKIAGPMGPTHVPAAQIGRKSARNKNTTAVNPLFASREGFKIRISKPTKRPAAIRERMKSEIHMVVMKPFPVIWIEECVSIWFHHQWIRKVKVPFLRHFVA
jgi:hypothetical protein